MNQPIVPANVIHFIGSASIIPKKLRQLGTTVTTSAMTEAIFTIDFMMVLFLFEFRSF